MYERFPEGPVENENVKLLWDMNIQCDNIIEARRLDTVLVKLRKRRKIVQLLILQYRQILDVAKKKFKK